MAHQELGVVEVGAAPSDHGAPAASHVRSRSTSNSESGFPSGGIRSSAAGAVTRRISRLGVSGDIFREPLSPPRSKPALRSSAARPFDSPAPWHSMQRALSSSTAWVASVASSPATIPVHNAARTKTVTRVVGTGHSTQVAASSETGLQNKASAYADGDEGPGPGHQVPVEVRWRTAPPRRRSRSR